MSGVRLHPRRTLAQPLSSLAGPEEKSPLRRISRLHKKNILKANFTITQEKDFQEKLQNEDKFILCCDSKSTAEVYYKMLNDKTIKLITSDTTDKIESLTKYDKIIFSPKIIYGLDSQNARPVYAVYGGQTITPYQMVQQITRERQLTEVNVFFPTPKSHEARVNFCSNTIIFVNP